MALTTLIELAQRATDQAAQRLGFAIQGSTDLKNKLSLLENYRQEYVAKMQEKMRTGCDISYIRNYQTFLGKIDQAIKEQHQLIDQSQQKISTEQHHWREEERKKSSYLKLQERAAQVAFKKDAKREQRQQDEYALRQLHK